MKVFIFPPDCESEIHMPDFAAPPMPENLSEEPQAFPPIDALGRQQSGKGTCLI